MSTELNLMTREWLHVFNTAKEEINQCLVELANFNVTHDRSNYLRGRIDALKLIIDIDPHRTTQLTVKPFSQ